MNDNNEYIQLEFSFVVELEQPTQLEFDFIDQ